MRNYRHVYIYYLNRNNTFSVNFLWLVVNFVKKTTFYGIFICLWCKQLIDMTMICVTNL